MDKDQYNETLEVLQTLVKALNEPKGIIGYVIFLEEDGKKPYFGMKVSDAKKLQK